MFDKKQYKQIVTSNYYICQYTECHSIWSLDRIEYVRKSSVTLKKNQSTETSETSKLRDNKVHNGLSLVIK